MTRRLKIEVGDRLLTRHGAEVRILEELIGDQGRIFSGTMTCDHCGGPFKVLWDEKGTAIQPTQSFLNIQTL